MSVIYSKIGLKIGVETTPGVRIEPDTIIYIEDENKAIPKVEFTKKTYTPSGAFSGSEEDEFYDKFAKLPYEITFPLSDNIEIMRKLLLVSDMKEENILDGENTIGYKFTPNTNGTKTLSYDIYTPRQKFKGKAGKCTFSLTADTDDRVMVKVTIEGDYEDIETKAVGQDDFVVPFADTPSFIRLDTDTSYKVDTSAADLTKFEFDFQGTIAQKKRVLNGNFFYISNFNPMVKITADLTESTELGFDTLLNKTTTAQEIDLKDSANSTKYKLIVPKCMKNEPKSQEDSDGMFSYTDSFKCKKTTGDDNFSLEIYI